MTPDERSRIPPPPRCRSCECIAEYLGANARLTQIEKRYRCVHRMTGGIMTPDCAWHITRRDGIATQESDDMLGRNEDPQYAKPAPPEPTR